MRNLLINGLAGFNYIIQSLGVVLFLDIDNGVPKVTGLGVFFEVDRVFLDEVPLLEVGVRGCGKFGYLLVGFEQLLVDLLEEFLVIDVGQAL